MNLREANLYRYFIWFKLYSVRQSYKIDALRPQDWDQLIDQMTNDPQVFDMSYKVARPNCDTACKKRILCDLRSGRSHDRKNLCEDIEMMADDSSSTTWKQWFYNTISVS
ncbi:uncharacterized protein CBL_20292 [Carabus blaptoides fortunei]